MLITLGEGDKAPKCMHFVIMLRRVLQLRNGNFILTCTSSNYRCQVK